MRSRTLILAGAMGAALIALSDDGRALEPTAGAQQANAQGYYEEPGLVFSRSRLPRVKREDMDEYGKKVYDEIVRSDPSYRDGVRSGLAMLLYSPRLAEPLFAIRDYIRDMPVGERFTELAILVASRERDNQFEWTRTERGAAGAGLEPEIVDVVKYGKDPGRLGDKEALIIHLGREMMVARKVREETFDRALKVFGKRDLMDLVGTMSFFNFLHDTIIAFDLQRVTEEKLILPTLPKNRYAGLQTTEAVKSRPFTSTPSVSSARLPLPTRDDMPDEYSRKVYDAVINSDPGYRNGVRTAPGFFLYSPRLAEHLFPIRNYIRDMPVGNHYSELALLVAAREEDNQFEWTGHARGAELEPGTMDVVKFRKDPAGLAEKDAVIVRFVRELVGERKVSSPTFAQALKVFGPRDLMDLIGTVAFYDNFVWDVVTVFDVHRITPPELVLPDLRRN